MALFFASQLEELGRAIFASAGAPVDIAEQVSRSLTLNNLMGHDSHGVLRIPGYVQEIERGTLLPAARPMVEKETATTAVVDGNWGFGLVAARYAMKLAIEKARVVQVAAATISRCNHIGRLGDHVELAAAEGMIGLVFCGILRPDGGGPVAPHGGVTGVFGTNPISVAVPATDDEPVVLDVATSMVAEGKLRVARAKNQPVASGAILDRDGRPSVDARDFYDSGALLPFGGHKGYGLSVITDLLGQLATGGNFGDAEEASGVFMLVANVGAFRPPSEYRTAVARRLQQIKGVPPAPGFDEVLVPGEPERYKQALRAREGIVLPEETCHRLGEIAKRLGVAMPEPHEAASTLGTD